MAGEHLTSEKCLEYQQVAALVCMDIDIFYKCAVRFPDKALEFFKLLKEMKDKAISDPADRKMRFDASVTIFHAAKAGMIVGEEIEP